MKKCKRCNKIHLTPLDVNQLSEEDHGKLRQMVCSTFKDGYVGSILTETHHLEYYEPLVAKKLIIEIKQREEEQEEEIEEGDYESTSYWQQEMDYEAEEKDP